MENVWATTVEKPQKASKVPVFTLIARIVSVVTFVASLAILKGNNFDGDAIKSAVIYEALGSYQYMFSCLLVGIVYTISQTPFATYYALKKKRLINHNGYLLFEFCADKVMICILGTAVGAAFGVTKDFKYATDNAPDDPNKSHFDTFFNLNYLASGFLFLGFLCSVALSFFSSRPVSIDK